MGLFRAKNEKVIRRIQDALGCCGLHTTVDKAWPFQDKQRGVDACVKRYERTKSCFAGWRDEERGAAGMIVGVVVGVVVWKVLVLLVRSRGAPWHNQEDGEAEQVDARNGGRRVLEYPDAETPYRDVPAIEDVNDDDAVLASRVQPSQLRDDAETWANER